jgi:serine/threonine protein phosphatase PrpC
VRDGKVTLLSEDHSGAGLLLAKGTITEEHSKIHPLKNQILFACGMVCDVFNTNTFEAELKPGDKILLTTDGLHDNLLQADIAKINTEDHLGFDRFCKKLIAVSRFRGIADNSTLVAINYSGTADVNTQHYTFNEKASICISCGCDSKKPCQIITENSSTGVPCRWNRHFPEILVGVCNNCKVRGIPWVRKFNW